MFGGENDAQWTPPPSLDAAFQLGFARRSTQNYSPSDTCVPVAMHVYVPPINNSRVAGDLAVAASSSNCESEISNEMSSLPRSDHYIIPDKLDATLVLTLLGLQLRRIAGSRSPKLTTHRDACDSRSHCQMMPLYATEHLSTALRANVVVTNSHKQIFSLFRDSKRSLGRETIKLSITGLETVQNVAPALSLSIKADLFFGNLVQAGVLGVFRGTVDELSTENAEVFITERDIHDMQNCGSIDYSQDTDGTITLAGTKRIRRLVSCSLANQHKYEICDLCPTSASSGFVNTFQKKSLKYQSHHLTSISKKCYISGGVGALGQLVASWYSKHTSLNTILLAARSGRTHKARSVWHDGALLACLTRNDIATTEDAVSCDDHDFSDFVHTGGILNDLALHDQNTLSFVTSMSPKVHGLRKFVPGSTPCKATTRTILFSSIAALLGSSGQANYCAANSCLDTWALSTMHSGAGGVTNSVQWGAWRSVGGMASENPSVLSRLDRLGFGSLTPNTGLRALQAAIFSLTHVQNRVICINPFDWKRFFANLHRPTKFFQEIETVADSHAAASDAVKEISTLPVKEISTLSSEDIAKHSQVVKVDLHSTIISAVRVILGRDVGQEEPFVDAGIDSLSSVELRNGLVNSPTLIAAFGADRLKEYVPATVVFDFPNVSVLSTHLSQYCEPEVKTTVEFFELASEDVHDDKVALSIENIVGELPAITKYSHIASDALGLISGDRWQVDDESAPTARFGGILEEIEKFDASIFHITHVEALYIDPQHRSHLKLALESVSQQLTSFDMDQSSTGVAVGISGNEYAQLCNASVAVSPYTALGGFMSVSCGRLSYTFGFGGMSFAVDTACSSGLVATHLAAANIRNIGGKTRQMLCAAANVTLLPTTTNMFVVSHMIASDGRCKTFDVTAAGYVRSEAAVTSILQ